MENLVKKGQRDVYYIPSVNFDVSGKCVLEGESYLDEPYEFYNELLDWLENYFETIAKPLTLDIKLSYFNTSSTRCILDILNALKDFEDSGGEVTVNWYYDKQDFEMEEEIEDFMKDSGLKMNMLPSSKV